MCEERVCLALPQRAPLTSRAPAHASRRWSCTRSGTDVIRPVSSRAFK